MTEEHRNDLELLEELNRLMEDLDPGHAEFTSVPPALELDRLKFRYPSLREVIAGLMEMAMDREDAEEEGEEDVPVEEGEKEEEQEEAQEELTEVEAQGDEEEEGEEQRKPKRKVVTPQELLDEVGSKDDWAKAIAEGLTREDAPKEELSMRAQEKEDGEPEGEPESEGEGEDEEDEEEGAEEEESGAQEEEPPVADEPMGPGPAPRPAVRKVVTLSELLDQIDDEDSYAKEIIEGLAEDERKLVEMRIRSKVERLRAELNLDSAQKVTMEYLLDRVLEGGRDLVEQRLGAKEKEYQDLDEKYAAKDRSYREKDEQFDRREQELKDLVSAVSKHFDEKSRAKLTTVETTVHTLVKALRHGRKKLKEHTRLEEERRTALGEYRKLLENRKEMDAALTGNIVSFKDLFFKNFSQFFTSVEDRVGWTNVYESQLSKFVEKKSAEIFEAVDDFEANEEVEEIVQDFHGFYLAVEVLIQVANYYREICVNARQEANGATEAKEHLARFVQQRLPDEQIDDILHRAGEELMPKLLAIEKDIDDSGKLAEKDLRFYYQKSEKQKRELAALIKEFEVREPALAKHKDEMSKLAAVYTRYVQNAEQVAGAGARIEELTKKNEELTAKRRRLTMTLLEEFEKLRKTFEKSRQYIDLERSMSTTNVTRAIESIPDEFRGVHDVFGKLLKEIDSLQERNSSIISDRDREMQRLLDLARRKTRTVLPRGAQRELNQLRVEVEQLRGRNHELKLKVLKKIVPRLAPGGEEIPEQVAEMSRRLGKARDVLTAYDKRCGHETDLPVTEIDLDEEAALPMLLGDYVGVLSNLEYAVDRGIVPVEKALAKRFERATKRLPEELSSPDVLLVHARVEGFMRRAEEAIAENARHKAQRIKSFVESNREVLEELLTSGFDTVSVEERLQRLDQEGEESEGDKMLILLDYASLRSYVTSCLHGEEDASGPSGFGTLDLTEAEKERLRLVSRYGYESFEEFREDMDTLAADLTCVKGESKLDEAEKAFLTRFRYKRLATVLEKLTGADTPKLLGKLYQRTETPDVEGDLAWSRRILQDREALVQAKTDLVERAQRLDPSIRTVKRDLRRAVEIIGNLVGRVGGSLERMARLEEEKERLITERNRVPGIETFDGFHDWLRERKAELDEIETEPKEKATVCRVGSALLGKKNVDYPKAMDALSEFVDTREFTALRKDLEVLSDLCSLLRKEFRSGYELKKALKAELKLLRPFHRDLGRLQERKAVFVRDVLELG